MSGTDTSGFVEGRGYSGGARPGSARTGRPGAKTVARQEYMKALSESIGRVLPEGYFEGDAHAFLVACYRDPRVPLDMRIQAAETAIKYELPALQAIAVKTQEERTIVIEMLPSDSAL